MHRHFLIILLFLLSFADRGTSYERSLNRGDIRPTMQQMLSYHVEFKEFSPLIARRSFKLFLEQFDLERSYLLQDETRRFLELSDRGAEEVVESYYNDDYKEYAHLNATIAKAIERAREVREEVERELILTVDQPSAVPGESYLNQAASEDEQRERIRKKLLRFLYAEKRQTPGMPWTIERRAKIFAFLEKRLRRYEEAYLSGKKGEHYLATHILKAMAKSLDAHTAFFSPEEAFEMRTSLEKQFEGVGVVLREDVEGVIIVDLIKGGPAERCGMIAPGDFLVEIDGKSVVQDPYEEVLEKLKGDGRKEVALGVKRFLNGGDERLLRVNLKREKIVMQSERLSAVAEAFGDGVIAKITLPSFYESDEGSSCERDMREALRRLKVNGKIRGVVLDLRENLGGFLNQAVKVAGLFINSGVIVISKYAQGELQYLRDIDGRVYYTGPLLVLTSKASASAAEIVAQALQDYGTALVVGDERTYGKGSIQYQNVTERGPSTFFKVTVGKYYTVSGRSTQIEGVKADIVVPTAYSVYKIGERYLEYPLKNDRLPSAYVEPASELDKKKEHWWQRSLPQTQKQSFWTQICPLLKANSAQRLEKSKNFQTFLKSLKADTPLQKKENWGDADLQMNEAVNILKDMIIEQSKAS
ncbi:MAG: PDZ domain-containing protein [Chlamydiales bacterium]|nr:PDZ domain-containing protein [Chlamydiales bacterium]